MKMDKHRYHCISLLYILILLFPLHAQWENIRFSHLSMDDGLSQSTIFCILQDSNGFMWFGTYSGLNKFNGYDFTIYKPEKNNTNSLSNYTVYSICEDRYGLLWIGTDNGLNTFDQKKERFTCYLHNPDDANSLSNNRVYSVFEDKSGLLWIGTDGGLNKFDREKGQFIQYQFDPEDSNSVSNNYIRSVYEERSGSLWIGTYGGGLNKFDREKEQFTRYKNAPDDANSLSNNRVYSVFEDKSGLLWVGTEGGLNKFDRKKRQFSRYQCDPEDSNSLATNDIRFVYEDRSGSLWIGSYGGGLNKFDREKEQFTRYKNDPDDSKSLSDNHVLSIIEDRSGILWIGTYNRGLNKFSRGAIKFLHYQSNHRDPHSLSHNIVRSFFEDRSGMLWVGTEGGGLNKFNREKKQCIHYWSNPEDPYSVSSDFIYSIIEDQSGVFWIGTYGGGLNKFEPRKEKFTHYRHSPHDDLSLSDDRIRTICRDSSNILWIGTDGGGLDKFDCNGKKISSFKHDPNDSTSLSNNRVFSIVEDRSLDVLWIGTFGGGVNKFDPKKEQFIHYRHNPDNTNSLSNDWVIAIHKDRFGILWIGSNGGGVTKFDPLKNTFLSYMDSDGLSDNTAYGILEDEKGNLWISTNNGISKFNPETERFETYDESDGIQEKEFNGNACYRSEKSGEMFFGGINGFNAFFPDSMRENPYIPPVVITDFQIFNKSASIGETEDNRSVLTRSIVETKEITLSYKDNVFSFSFAALNYLAPEKNQYAYMMKGFDEDWIYSGTRRFVTYTNLNPGKYVFRVKGSNNDGLWNEDGTSLKITIVPPFWKTLWFYTICLVGAILLIAAIISYWVDRMEEKRKEEERRRVINDVGQVLEHGRATIYRRNVDSEEYDYMGNGIRYITGYDPEEYNLAVWYKIVISVELIGENAELSMEEAITRMKEGMIDNFVMDFSVRTKSGDVRWARDITTALRDESGNCSAYLGIMFDITDRKNAEQELAQKRKSIQRTLFEHTPDPIMIFDKETRRFLDCNKAFMTVYGYSKEEIRSMTPFSLHPPEEFDKVERDIGVKNIDVPNGYKHITKDGRILDVEILTDETVHKGKPAWISMVRNITEHKLTEQRLTQLTNELKSKNEEMEADLILARDVQMALLSHNYPKNFPPNVPPEQSTLQFAHRYIPTSALAGDFFEILPISDHQVGVMIYDVMGHGVRASLLTAYLHGLMEELMPIAVDPVAFFNRLNLGINAVTIQFYTGMFATAFYCVVDLHAGIIHYTNAGHPSPYIVQRNSDSVKKIANSGKKPDPALGLFPTQNYTAYEYPMTEVDTVFFYTDGLYEVENKNSKIFGKERLLKAVKSQLHKTPEMMLDGILSEVNKFAGTREFIDDVCMVTMHVRNDDKTKK